MVYLWKVYSRIYVRNRMPVIYPPSLLPVCMMHFPKLKIADIFFTSVVCRFQARTARSISVWSWKSSCVLYFKLAMENGIETWNHPLDSSRIWKNWRLTNFDFAKCSVLHTLREAHAYPRKLSEREYLNIDIEWPPRCCNLPRFLKGVVLWNPSQKTYDSSSSSRNQACDWKAGT